MTFDEIVKVHAKGWKTGFCQCDWCNTARQSVTRGADYYDEQDHEEARANQEDWWAY